MSDASRPDPARLARWTVTSGSNVNSRAAVVIRAGDHDWKASAEGNGAVDALYKAVDGRWPTSSAGIRGSSATTSTRSPRARTPRAR